MAGMADQVHHEVRERILSGQLTPGSWLREGDIAAEVGVSRTPVREALRRLDAEGLVELVRNRGAKVADWLSEDLDEMFQLRGLLEGFGAGLAATRITAAELDLLEASTDRMAHEIATGAPNDQIVASNHEFHMMVATAAGSVRLRQVIDQLTQVALLAQTIMRYTASDLQRSVSQHREIIAALRAANAPWARTIMEAHVLGARHTFDPVH